MKPLVPEDLFLLETIGEMQLSCDGNWLAFETQRATDSGPAYPLAEWYNARAEIRVLATDGSVCTQITNGKKDGCGYFEPQWSPSSRYLAMLAIFEIEHKCYVWDSTTHELKLATEKPIYTWFRGTSLQWLSEHELLCVICPGADFLSRPHTSYAWGTKPSRPGLKHGRGNRWQLLSLNLV